MKQVTISTSMDSPSTRASLDSETGAFSWQSGDLISVLATDGNFYDFILESGVGNYEAEFVGSIPENAYVTTVATYPRIVSNGSANTVLVGSTLNYNLPATWTYAKDVSNVPMVAAFSENATHMAFKQVGGVMRFPVKNMPTEAKFIITMEDKTITGAFPVDINNLGTSAMTAGSSASELVINYSSEIDGAYAEFNVPVPTGTYNNFTLTIKDANDKVLFTKEYTSDINKVERATLLNMKEITLPERPMTIAEVWPFFVDARVVFSKVEGVTDYAFYVDGSETPVILTAEELNNGMYGGLIGGQFAHNTTHTVAVAKVVDGTPVADSKSEAVEFTTGRIMQLTTNTGTKFISAGWDDVAIGKENSTVYDETTKKWSIVVEDGTTDYRSIRGYRVQLYAEDKTTLLYDEIPSNSQIDYGGSYASSSWLGKVGGNKQLIPTAISFGWLEPGKKYYIRVQTLAEPVIMNSPETGCFEPNTAGYRVSSERGGCAWSEFVEVTTDPAHVASENEILYEGFDDMMYNGDIMNASPGVTPQILTAATTNYQTRASADLYKAWVAKPFAEREFTTHNFSDPIHAYNLGLTDDARVDSNTPRYLNAYAGSLEGWAIRGGGEDKRGIYPSFGAVRLGQSNNATGYVELRTPALQSDKLSNDVDTKCIVTVKVSTSTTDKPNPAQILGIYHYRGDVTVDNSNKIYINQNADGTIKSEWTENYTWTDANNYKLRPTWFEVSTEMNLRNGDIISFDRPNVKYNGESNYYRGFLVLGEIKIEVAPEEENTFADDGVGTEPDNTNYDVFGLEEFPITYYFGPPTAWYTKYNENGQAYYDDELTKQTYQDIKNAGFNIATYVGEIDCSIAENARLLNICNDLGLKFISNVGGGGVTPDVSVIPEIKEKLYTSPAYLGDIIRDEPKATEFDVMGNYVKEYLNAMPDKEVYVNLFPMYASPTQLASSSYEAHINDYIAKVPTKSISYDFYGLKTQTDIHTLYYKNLDLVREKTLDVRKPFWVITQAGPISTSTIDPNEEQQRWSVWSNIALGSKGISYFTYWTPPASAGLNESEYMVRRDGTKRDIYYWIKQINADIKTIGKKLLPCHADGAICSRISYHYMWSNDGMGRTKYGPIQKVGSGLNNYQVLCGCFRDARTSENGENYKGYKALVMSQMPNRDVQALLTLDSAITKITVTHNNTSQEVTISAGMNVTVGDITLSYVNDQLAVNIPNGEAALIEF